MNMEVRVPASSLERHARLLLRAYPPAYRAQRGAEILDTLLEVTPPGYSWPQARDTRSLLAAGLRARAARNGRLGAAVSIRQAALFGLSLYVIHQVFLHLFTLSSSDSIGGTPTLLASCVLLTAVVVAAWLGRRALTAITAVPACATLAYYAALASDHYNLAYGTAAGHDPARLLVPSVTAGFYLVQLPLALSVAALAMLTRRDARPPLTWLWLPALLLAEMAAGKLSGAGYPFVQQVISTAGPVTSLLSVPTLLFVIPILIWLVTDTRPALGLAAFLAVLELSPTISGAEAFLTAGSPSLLRQSRTENAVILVLMLALTVGLARVLRRRARRGREAAAS
jgi:hypothetical protein